MKSCSERGGMSKKLEPFVRLEERAVIIIKNARISRSRER